MQKPYKSIRIFERDWMEWFTHVNPLTPLMLWVPVIAFFIYRSLTVLHLGVSSTAAWFSIGLVLWTFIEYVLHRFVFHFHPEGKVQEYLQYLLHGIHHDDPVDPTRLVMPPFVSVLLGSLFFLGFRTIFGAVLVEPYFAGFLVGYLCYDYIHFSVHHFKPKTKIGKFLKQSHMHHHFVSPNARWGVSSPIWDYVFGTLEENKKGAKRVRHGS